MTAADLPHVEGLDPTVWEGSSSGLLDQDDLALVGESIAEGSLAVVVVFENLWVLDLVGRWTASGGRMILDERGTRRGPVGQRSTRQNPDEENTMGLLSTAAKVAVASSVHGRVQRRQQNRWAEQDRQRDLAAGYPPPGPPPPAPSGAPDVAQQLDMIRQLNELRLAGALTDAEFEAKKAQILQT